MQEVYQITLNEKNSMELTESLHCKACGYPLDHEQNYLFDNDLCEVCSRAVEQDLESDEE